jgi:hypothetical protein
LEVLEGIGLILFGGITLKAEFDNWNSHSDDFRRSVIAQYFFGSILFLVVVWTTTAFPVGSVNSTVPALVFFAYIGICWALNSYRSLNEESLVSKNFSEFWLFGFFKRDDYFSGIVCGWILAGVCLSGIFNCVVLHQSILTNSATVASVSSSRGSERVVRGAPAADRHAPSYVSSPRAHADRVNHAARRPTNAGDVYPHATPYRAVHALRHQAT